jgi:3-deoxy-7-phosphoheptulonate synthase
MLIIMSQDATEDQVESVVSEVRKMGYSARVHSGQARTTIDVPGAESPLDGALVDQLPGVLQALRVNRPFELASRDLHPDDTVVQVGDVKIGGKALTIIAGPCAIESKDQLFEAAKRAKSCGVQLLRGGAFKPRTSPYSFQGLGEEGMKLLREAGEYTGLPVVSEAVDEESVELAREYVDLVQVGARNMQNYVLLKRVARCGKPVLLKRGVAATLEEFLGAAEYVLSEGNPNLILCERGIRTFSDYTRNTLDLSIIPAIKALSHLPIITDPSHATGRRDMVVPLARASIAAGADGVMVEMHPDPSQALSDGYQSLHPPELEEMMRQIAQIAPVVGRTIPARR